MEPTIAVLNGFLFLLPGLVALWIGEELSKYAKASTFDRVIDALFLTLAASLLYVPFTAVVGSGIPIFTIKETIPKGIDFIIPNLRAFGALVGASVVLGVAYGIYIKKRVKLDVWTRVFQEMRARWVLVHLGDGTKILGWPARYSDDPTRREIFIKDAAVFDKEWNRQGIEGSDVLLTDQSKITAIEFLNPREHTST